MSTTAHHGATTSSSDMPPAVKLGRLAAAHVIAASLGLLIGILMVQGVAGFALYAVGAYYAFAYYVQTVERRLVGARHATAALGSPSEVLQSVVAPAMPTFLLMWIAASTAVGV